MEDQKEYPISNSKIDICITLFFLEDRGRGAKVEFLFIVHVSEDHVHLLPPAAAAGLRERGATSASGHR